MVTTQCEDYIVNSFLNSLSVILSCFAVLLVLPGLAQNVEEALITIADEEQHRKLCDSAMLVADKVKMIKSALKCPSGTGIGLFRLVVFAVVCCL